MSDTDSLIRERMAAAAARKTLGVHVSIRIADEADVPALAGLRRLWNEENTGAAIDDPGFDSAFFEWWSAERETRTFFVAEADHVAVGMANVKRYDRMPHAGRVTTRSWGYVGNVFVVAAHRNAGVGHALMNSVVAWASRRRLAHLRLAPSPLSRPFYERLGFLPGTVLELDPPIG